jgi:glycosyltransferase involved in cell wall biosynthesis
MRIVQIYAKEFGYGGVEREVITLANALVNIYNIELIFMTKKHDFLPYKISNKIKISYISDSIKINGILKNINLAKYMKSSLNEHVDTVISTDVIFNEFIATSNIKNKIYWEHNHHDNRIEVLDNIANRLTTFNTIVVPTRILEEYYQSKTNINVVMIQNIIELNGDLLSNLDSRRLVSVGKLESDKCFDKLINVMKLVNEKDKSISLSIIGDGSERQSLEELVHKNKLQKCISFYGTLEKDELIDEYVHSSLFVTCSQKDSFCLSLMEAMTVGVPAVAFVESSLIDVIDNDINGYLVDNQDERDMANKILEIMNDDELRHNLGNCARETISVYDVNNLKSEWIKII